MSNLQEGDVEFDGYRVRIFQGGTGKPLLLLHGTGPGTSAAGNFSRIIERLSEKYTVLAADLIGFGKSDRKTERPYFDFDLWYQQARFLLGLISEKDLCVFGHSLSGALALKLAAEDSRVKKVLTTGTLGISFPVNNSLKLTWTYPDTRQDVINASEALVYDNSIIDSTFVNNRVELLQTSGYKKYFSEMFGGEQQLLVDSAILGEELLDQINADVLMMHGREDRPVPVHQTSLRLGGMIRNCDVSIIGRCGHSPSMEHPDKVLSAARLLFN
tara:strand:- start:1920 stop:2735 length:816 start_codon:yes stop_codon:yes gene_type:complete